MSQETELIKERLDLAEVIGEYVPLKRMGQHYKTRCPFHQEKTPSFVVSPEKGIWHCFGCGKGGDHFSFIQEIEGVEFPEALKSLAERAGVTLQQTPDRHVAGKRERLFDLLQLTARFYQEILLRQAAGKKALAYLKKRGVALATAEQFQLGYAPTGWDTLQAWLRKRGFHPNEMVAAGVVGESRGGKMYDRFRGRIMFPITDVQGRVVAFGGRIVPWHETGNEGKYVNSPEGMLYEKRRVVYNLAQAKRFLRHNTPCVVVEGYLDVVMSVQAGLGNVVASSGTAFTAEQVTLLKRYTDTLHFAFDGDAAGFKAQIAATQAALAGGMRVASIILPPGQDPADLAQQNPKAAVAYLQAPRSLIEVLLKRLGEETDATTQEEQLQMLLPLLQQVRNPVQQGKMVHEAAQHLHVSEGRILSLLDEMKLASTRPGKRESGEELAPPGGQRAATERQLLGLLLLHPSIREAIWLYVDSDLFLDADMRNLYNSMQVVAEAKSNWLIMPAEDILLLLPQKEMVVGEAVRAMARDYAEQLGGEAVVEAKGLLRRLQQLSLEERLRALQQTVVTAEGSARVATLKEFQSLAEKLDRVKDSVD